MLNIRKFLRGLGLVPDSGSNTTAAGELQVQSDDSNKLQYHNGSSSSSVVTEVHASQGTHRLKSKDLEDSTTQIVDNSDTTKVLKFDAAGTTGTSTTLTGSQTSNRVLTLPDATDTLVGKATTDVLTNKSIDSDNNTLINIVNANIKAAAGIVDTKLATISTAGKVSNSATTAASANTASAIVARDGSGNFSAGTITATLSGNATNVSGTVAIEIGGTGQTSAGPAFNALAPATTKGGIIGATGANAYANLPVGTNNQVLMADSSQSTGLKWGNTGSFPTAAQVTADASGHTIVLGADVQAQLNSTDTYLAQLIFPGMVMAYAGVTVPNGWLLCDGSFVSRTTYANLFAAIGVQSGYGNGTTTFALPDYRGYFLRGVAGTSGTTNDPDSLTRTNLIGGTYNDTGTGTMGSPIITGLTSTINIAIGAYFTDGGLPGDTVVVSVDSSTQVTLSQNSVDSLPHTYLIGNAATGNAVGSIQANENQGHTHDVGNTTPNTSAWSLSGGVAGYNVAGSQATSSSGGLESRPLNAYVNYIIKT